MKDFLKTPIVGGVLFLLPLGLVLFILAYALRLATSVAQPISKALHLDQLGDVAGIGITTVVGVILLVVISFAAGLVGRTSIGGRISGWFFDLGGPVIITPVTLDNTEVSVRSRGSGGG